jgi:hypothetical protein
VACSSYKLASDARRRSQVVKAGVCKTPIVGSNPTVASEDGREKSW